MVITGIFLKIKFKKKISTPFVVANTNQNEKKIAPPGVVCHGLQENAFQVNQLYNVTWSTDDRANRVNGLITT